MEDKMITNIADYAGYQEGIKQQAAKMKQLEGERLAEIGKYAQIGKQVVENKKRAANEEAMINLHTKGMQDGAKQVVRDLYDGLAKHSVMQDPMNQGGNIPTQRVKNASDYLGIPMNKIDMDNLKTLDESNKPNY